MEKPLYVEKKLGNMVSATAFFKSCELKNSREAGRFPAHGMPCKRKGLEQSGFEISVAAI